MRCFHDAREAVFIGSRFSSLYTSVDCLAVVVRCRELAHGGGGVSTPGVGCRGFIQNTSKQRGLEEEEETRGGVSAHSDFLLQVHRVLSFESP